MQVCYQTVTSILEWPPPASSKLGMFQNHEHIAEFLVAFV